MYYNPTTADLQLTSFAEAAGTAFLGELLGGPCDASLPSARPLPACDCPKGSFTLCPDVCGTPASAIARPAASAISPAACLMAGPLLTADLLEGALPLEAAREAAEALLAAASAAAVAAAGLAGSWGRPAGAAAAAVTDCGICKRIHSALLGVHLLTVRLVILLPTRNCTVS